MSDKRRARWPYFTAQPILLFAAIGVVIGAFLPWALIVGHGVGASPLALSWMLWAALIILTATIVRWRVVVAVSALAGGATPAVFALWQTARILDRCALSLDCLPGPGVGLLLAAGGTAVYQGIQVARGRARVER